MALNDLSGHHRHVFRRVSLAGELPVLLFVESYTLVFECDTGRSSLVAVLCAFSWSLAGPKSRANQVNAFFLTRFIAMWMKSSR